MTLSDLKELEAEQVNSLRTRALAGDNEAADVLLYHLREVSRAISQWQAQQPKRKSKNDPIP